MMLSAASAHGIEQVCCLLSCCVASSPLASGEQKNDCENQRKHRPPGRPGREEGRSCQPFLVLAGSPANLPFPEELQDGVLQKYRLHGLVGEDLSKLRFEPEGGPSPFKFKLPSVTHEYIEYYKSVMRKFNWEEGDQSAGRLGEVDNQGLVSNTLDDYTAGRDRCGEVVARLPEGWQYFEEVFDFEVCQLAGGEPKQLARWRAEGQVNNHCQCLGDRLMLFAGSRSGEDAFYEEMQLIDWQTQEVIRKIPLEFTPPYIESEWDRGILNGSTQTFFTHFPGVETETEGSTTFAFGTPEM